MDIVNFVVGQLVGLVEPFLVIRFVVKCLEWKNSIKYRKSVFVGFWLLWFVIAQGNGRFNGSYVVIIIIDTCLLCIFSFLFFENILVIKIMISILAEVINIICPLIIMQLMTYVVDISIFSFLKNEGPLFAVGAIVSKIILWLIYESIYPAFRYLIMYFPEDQIILTSVLIGFTIISENCIFQAVSQKGVSHYTIVLLLIVSLGIIALCGYVIYMMITISKKNEKMQFYQLIELKSQEQERQLEEWKYSEESMRKFRHDYKNHCMNMDHLLEEGEYESLGRYLKQFVTEELGEVRSIYSDSPIINAIFHNKMSICKEKGIDISCDITGSVKGLDDMGVGSILFNLLDNAIEACEKNKKEKRIVCRINREVDDVNIFVENSIEQSVLEENPSLETTKRKKEQHGMGHMIVEEQVKKLGGMVEYYEDEMFCAHVYLPM